ncbi:hypothetical protein PIB30_101329 [Stylosanthes scabra]|uniref:Uncharacterized protein n=1 Tax=Stylosanthes scabra TaxID=79078 RepID=A0ABU6V162_9FABA|nr:hypothetical protein [Stylosanthes scabra]
MYYRRGFYRRTIKVAKMRKKSVGKFAGNGRVFVVVIPLLELYVVLIDERNNSDADTKSRGGTRRNIRRLMLDLNRQPKGSNEGSISDSNQPTEDMVGSLDASAVGDPTTQPYLLNHDFDDDDVDSQPVFSSRRRRRRRRRIRRRKGTMGKLLYRVATCICTASH